MGATVAQPPELAGGAGFTFEDAGAGSYLTALFQQGYALGVKSRVVTRVAPQTAGFWRAVGRYHHRLSIGSR